MAKKRTAKKPALSKAAVETEEEEVEIVTTEVSEYRLITLALLLLAVGTAGFYHIPGLLQEDASGSKIVNAFYCTVMTLTTVGYGDICPGKLTFEGRVFLILFVFTGMGIFCGPIMSLASSWKRYVPGGVSALATLTIGAGATLFTTMEGLEQSEAIYASIIAGTTIGYGDVTPASDMGKVLVACYCILAIPVGGMIIEPFVNYLVSLCSTPKKGFIKLD